MIQRVSAIAREAGAMILNSHHAAIHQKAGHANFVTDTDVAVQAFLKKALLDCMPQARFFAEEQKNEPLTAAPTFVVDPIDGTMNFMRRRNVSAVSIALVENMQPVLGVVYQPYADELFSAEKGKGACCNGQPIHVSDTPFENALVTFGTSPYDAALARRTLKAAQEFLLQAADLRRTGSAAIDLCDVACGRTDIFFELELQPWDVAAGALIAMEAGARYDSLGHDAPYFQGACGVMACNMPCRDKARELLAAALT